MSYTVTVCIHVTYQIVVCMCMYSGITHVYVRVYINMVVEYVLFLFQLCVSKLRLFMEDADQNCESTYMCSSHNTNAILIIVLVYAYTCTEIVTSCLLS